MELFDFLSTWFVAGPVLSALLIQKFCLHFRDVKSGSQKLTGLPENMELIDKKWQS